MANENEVPETHIPLPSTAIPPEAVITEDIPNVYFGHVVDGFHTRDHGIFYSIAGVPYESLGHAVAFARENPVKPAGPNAPEPFPCPTTPEQSSSKAPKRSRAST